MNPEDPSPPYVYVWLEVVQNIDNMIFIIRWG